MKQFLDHSMRSGKPICKKYWVRKHKLVRLRGSQRGFQAESNIYKASEIRKYGTFINQQVL